MKSYVDYISDYISPDEVNFDHIISSESLVDDEYNDIATEAGVANGPTRAWAFIKNVVNKLVKLIQDWWNKSAITKLKATLKSKIVPYQYNDQIKILRGAVDKAKAKNGKTSDGGSLIPGAALMMLFTLRDADVINGLKAAYRQMKSINVKQQGQTINNFITFIGGKEVVDKFKEPIFGDKVFLDFDLTVIDKMARGSTSNTDRYKTAERAANHAENNVKKSMNDANANAQKRAGNNPQPKNGGDQNLTKDQPANASVNFVYDEINHIWAMEQDVTPGSVEATAKAGNNPPPNNPQPNNPPPTTNKFDDGKTTNTYSQDTINEHSKDVGNYVFGKYLGNQLTNNDVEMIGQGLTLVINIYSQLITKTAWYINRLEKDSRANPTVILNLLKEVQSRVYAIIRTCTTMITDMNVDEGNYKETDNEPNQPDEAVKPDIPQTTGN
jgi:hypothetical protein